MTWLRVRAISGTLRSVRRRPIALTALALTLSACSTSPPDGPYGNPYAILEEELADAHYVFVAAVTSDGSAGEIVLSPLTVLKGTLPVDEDGNVRLQVDHSYRSCTGLWLLDADLRPVDNLSSMHPLLDSNPMGIVRGVLAKAFPDTDLPNVFPNECDQRL